VEEKRKRVKKSKSSRDSQSAEDDKILTAKERYTRRKSYDASRSRAASPLPDVSRVKSTGYGVVDRNYVRGKHSRGKKDSGRSFALLPPVET